MNNRSPDSRVNVCPGCGIERSSSLRGPCLVCGFSGEAKPSDASTKTANKEGAEQKQMSQKSRTTYVLLGLFLGFFGIHNLYAARVAEGICQLITLFLLGPMCGLGIPVVFIWSLINIFFTTTDGEGKQLS